MRTKLFTSLLILSFLFFTNKTFAQTQKGNFALSGKTDGSFLFSKTKSGTDSIQSDRMKNNQYSFSLGAGYFVADNLNVGISGTYSYAYSKTESWNGYPGSENIQSSFSIIPQINYYLPVDGKLKPFVGAGAGYLWLQERDSRVSDNNNEVYTLSGLSLNGMAGLSYFIIPDVSFDGQIQYTRNRLKDKLQKEQIQTQNALGVTFGLTVFF